MKSEITTTIEFLLSVEARSLRMQRIGDYVKCGEVTPTAVVHVETMNMGMQELDADDVNHAEAIIETWIKQGWAKSARYHGFLNDGKLVRHSPIYDFQCYQNND